MNHFDPQVDLPLPSDYVSKCQSLRHDLRVGKAVIFQCGKDPSVIGKAGSENFWMSLLIGRLDGGQTILLTCLSDGYGMNKRWRYQIARYAEWLVDESFETFEELLKFLGNYRGIDL